MLRILREVNGGGGITITTEPWHHAKPEDTNQVLLRTCFEHNIVIGNTIDSIPDPYAGVVDFPRFGIMFWVACFDNIVTGNTIKHVDEGIRVQCRNGGIWVQGPNFFVGNTITDMTPGILTYTYYTRFFGDVGGYVYVSSSQFHSIGNVFRDNNCSGAQMGVAVGAFDHDQESLSYLRDDSDYVLGAGWGIMHTIVENNVMTNITGVTARRDLGFAICTSANWTLLRHNRLGRYPNIDFYLPAKTHQVLHIA
jgi:hypothetical protein